MYSGDIYSFGKGAKAVAMKGKYSRDDTTITPGPGAYNARLNVIKEHTGSVKMSQAERRTFAKAGDDKPGPGMYAGNLNSFGKGAVAVSIKGKYSRNEEITPGPGAYTARVDITKGHTGSIRMSKAQRQTMAHSKSEIPGPGMYGGNLNTFGKGTKAVTISGKYTRDDSTVSPGPGAYSAHLGAVRQHIGSVRMAQAERKTFAHG
jgi:hypothetical protein